MNSGPYPPPGNDNRPPMYPGQYPPSPYSNPPYPQHNNSQTLPKIYQPQQGQFQQPLYPPYTVPPPQQRKRGLWPWYKRQTGFAKVGLGCGLIVGVLLLFTCSLTAIGSTLPPVPASSSPKTIATTARPTVTPTLVPLNASTVAPTLVPTATPTPSPTATRTPSPTATPTPQPKLLIHWSQKGDALSDPFTVHGAWTLKFTCLGYNSADNGFYEMNVWKNGSLIVYQDSFPCDSNIHTLKMAHGGTFQFQVVTRADNSYFAEVWQ